MTVTSRDIQDQIVISLEDNVADFDVDGMVHAYVQEFGLTHDVDVDRYWALVARFEK